MSEQASPEEKNEQQESKAFFDPRIITGAPWMVMAKLALFFVYYAISVLTVRFLGKEQYGLLSLAGSFGAYLGVLCGLGLNTAIVRFIPELAAKTNKAGMRNLLVKVIACQLAVTSVVGLCLIGLQPWLNSIFQSSLSRFLMVVVAISMIAAVLKDFAMDSLTALFRTRWASGLSVLTGVLWLIGLAIFLPRRGFDVAPTPLAVCSAAFVLTGFVGIVLIWLHLRGLDWRSPPMGIGRKRILKLGGSVMLNGAVRMLMLQYTEIFFLGIYYPASLVGIYSLAYTQPLVVITFIPQAVRSLFSSGFAEAYTRDPDCLPRLVSGYYKVLILCSVPLTAFGVFFAPRAVVLIFGQDMAQAGPLASFFSAFHLMPMISMPLSMAIVTKEKVLQVLPLLILQLTINLLLDWLLIPRIGVWGGAFALLGTYLLTIPVRLYVVKRLVGGIWFPTRFFIRHAVTLGVLAGILWPLAPYLNIWTLFGLTLVYFGAYALLLRHTSLLCAADVEDFRQLNVSKLNRLLDWLVPQSS